MIGSLRKQAGARPLAPYLIVAAVLALAFILGQRASPRWVMLLLLGLGAAVLLMRPVLGLLVLIVAALAAPITIGTGTAVELNASALLVPVLTGVWLVSLVVGRGFRFAPSATNRPLALFLVGSLVSLLIGRVTWDPTVPVASTFLLVQLAQWSVFAFSAAAFWLTANLIVDERWLWRLTAFFLVFAGGLAILRTLPPTSDFTRSFTTYAFSVAPFCMLLTAVAAGQLLRNRALALPWRVFLIAILLACVLFAMVEQREVASNWVGMAAVVAVLLWLRFPRLRWPAIIALVALLALGVLGPVIYEFAGGDAEWDESGGSRLALIGRVIDVTMRNPVTGLGPAAYRPYANMEPLLYGRAYWLSPQVNSHNNFVDLFAHGGVLGLLLFFWFAWEFARLGFQLRARHSTGFVAGYVDGMLAAGAGALVLMAFADWILPFVYNVRFIGFQASVLVWLLMGGLVAIENWPQQATVMKARLP
ncbi:MAG: O-antigen ligase family protein [Anaerolineae bacterium]|jgi:hypothetical protein|nr:O-antigen ligase family protein [Anaerolineae bacterium]